MPNFFLSQDDCKSKLGKHLQAFRADRPSEWKMDDFIREAEQMYAEIVRLGDIITGLNAVCDCNGCRGIETAQDDYYNGA